MDLDFDPSKYHDTSEFFLLLKSCLNNNKLHTFFSDFIPPLWALHIFKDH